MLQFWNKLCFLVKLHKTLYLYKLSLYFQNLDGFWQSHEGLFPENSEKNRVSKCPINLVSKTPFFEVLKFKYLQKHLAIFKKPAKTLPADV